MSTHNICLHEEIGNIFMRLLLSGAINSIISTHIVSQTWENLPLDASSGDWQINLCFHTVWSKSLLPACWRLASLSISRVLSKDWSDRWMCLLIYIFMELTCPKLHFPTLWHICEEIWKYLSWYMFLSRLHTKLSDLNVSIVPLQIIN